MELAILIIVIIILCIFILSITLFLSYKYLGQNFFMKFRFKRHKKKFEEEELQSFYSSLTSTLARLSIDKVGALIIVQNNDNLNKYIEAGNKVDAAFFPEFVYTIFYNHQSPLHDGAIIINNMRIASISSYLPISKRVLEVKYGSRHRAAFGITEITDAIAFVVSETTGKITCMYLDDTFSLSSIPTTLIKEITDIFDNISQKE